MCSNVCLCVWGEGLQDDIALVLSVSQSCETYKVLITCLSNDRVSSFSIYDILEMKLGQLSILIGPLHCLNKYTQT